MHPALREIVQTGRALYEADEAAASSQDLRATLQALARINDADAPSALRSLDSKTEALLDAAALASYKRKHPQVAIPQTLFDASAWTPAQVREYAALALSDFPRSAGGRPPKQQRHEHFARRLMGLWRWSGGKGIPKDKLPLADAIREYRSPARFVRDMFERVGVRLSAPQLRAIRGQVLGPK